MAGLQSTNDSGRLDWPQEETEQGQGSGANGANTHLWEESWDDDDESEDFSKQLKYATLFPSHNSLLTEILSAITNIYADREEMKKVEGAK